MDSYTTTTHQSYTGVTTSATNDGVNSNPNIEQHTGVASSGLNSTFNSDAQRTTSPTWSVSSLLRDMPSQGDWDDASLASIQIDSSPEDSRPVSPVPQVAERGTPIPQQRNHMEHSASGPNLSSIAPYNQLTNQNIQQQQLNHQEQPTFGGVDYHPQYVSQSPGPGSLISGNRSERRHSIASDSHIETASEVFAALHGSVGGSITGSNLDYGPQSLNYPNNTYPYHSTPPTQSQTVGPGPVDAFSAQHRNPVSFHSQQTPSMIGSVYENQTVPSAPYNSVSHYPDGIQTSYSNDISNAPPPYSINGPFPRHQTTHSNDSYNPYPSISSGTRSPFQPIWNGSSSGSAHLSQHHSQAPPQQSFHHPNQYTNHQPAARYPQMNMVPYQSHGGVPISSIGPYGGTMPSFMNNPTPSARLYNPSHAGMNLTGPPPPLGMIPSAGPISVASAIPHGAPHVPPPGRPGAGPVGASYPTDWESIREYERKYYADYYSRWYLQQLFIQQKALAERGSHASQATTRQRLTPMKYPIRHARTIFSGRNKLISVAAGNKILVQSIDPIVIDIDEDEQHFFLSCWPGPLSLEETSKQDLIEYLSSILSHPRNYTQYHIWTLLLKILRQSGSPVTGPELADLVLTPDETTIIGEDSSELKFRKQLLLGKRRAALEYATKYGLWGHAYTLTFLTGTNLLESTSAALVPVHNQDQDGLINSSAMLGVVNKFITKLNHDDPLLYTLYRSLLEGRGLAVGGSRVPVRNLQQFAVLLANECSVPTAFDETNELVKLIVAYRNLVPQHLITMNRTIEVQTVSETYDFNPDTGLPYTRTTTSLKEINPLIDALIVNEIWEYVLSDTLNKQSTREATDSFTFNLLPYKIQFAAQLFDFGLEHQALKYCAVIKREYAAYKPHYLVSQLSTKDSSGFRALARDKSAEHFNWDLIMRAVHDIEAKCGQEWEALPGGGIFFGSYHNYFKGPLIGSVSTLNPACDEINLHETTPQIPLQSTCEQLPERQLVAQHSLDLQREPTSTIKTFSHLEHDNEMSVPQSRDEADARQVEEQVLSNKFGSLDLNNESFPIQESPQDNIANQKVEDEDQQPEVRRPRSNSNAISGPMSIGHKPSTGQSHIPIPSKVGTNNTRKRIGDRNRENKSSTDRVVLARQEKVTSPPHAHPPAFQPLFVPTLTDSQAGDLPLDFISLGNPKPHEFESSTSNTTGTTPSTDREHSSEASPSHYPSLVNETAHCDAFNKNSTMVDSSASGFPPEGYKPIPAATLSTGQRFNNNFNEPPMFPPPVSPILPMRPTPAEPIQKALDSQAQPTKMQDDKEKKSTGGIFRLIGDTVGKLIPPGPPEMKLPKDDKPAIVWNEQLKRYVNTDAVADPEEEERQAQLQAGPPRLATMIGGSSVNSQGPPAGPLANQNMFTMGPKKVRRPQYANPFQATNQLAN